MATDSKMLEYFETKVDKKEFAKTMRRLLNATITLHIRDTDGCFKEWVDDGYYHLTQFVEVLDPQLQDAE